MQLSNNEGLTIEINETSYGFCLITVNGRDYAQFQSASINEINLEYLVYWIENTYYDNSYLSSAYIPCDLNLSEFTL